ncbi:hypothetical protein Dret_1045 [Desulfohalobium retbaense DSM 5692]|uniref:Uncharacterized protein n=1 Tax=Desulfohalobium retbaense (strain ATCC 49708 / DSM 5692 / JCM 16813 / HR100) TaxID=485915 RepID=C8X210_DESRD|nr:hypothetical protein Dret_1045 [Desulfohalobium retbaense DSM 5692]
MPGFGRWQRDRVHPSSRVAVEGGRTFHWRVSILAPKIFS